MPPIRASTVLRIKDVPFMATATDLEQILREKFSPEELQAVEINITLVTSCYEAQQDTKWALVDFHPKRGKPTKKMWLRDFLAQDFPKCRTMIYGYNSNLKSRGFHTLKDYKLEFLKEIARIRSSEEEVKRPIIFIGHSFGGLVIAQSLVEAATSKSEKDALAGNQDLVASTCAVMFFGTPHRGILMNDVRKMLEEDNHNPRIGLLEEIENELNLEPDLKEFIKLASAGGFKVVSFYERLQTAEVVKVCEYH
ncbi:hypothetical protein RUND412_005018 [Rhizina undulata]